jgi:phosphate:Na+ symporter
VLRDIEVVRAVEIGSDSLLQLDKLKLEIEEKTGDISHGLDKLIRKDRIDVQIATSLMNDISYCRETCWDLVEAASVLFSVSNLDERVAMRSIALDEHEISEMLENSDEEVAQ